MDDLDKYEDTEKQTESEFESETTVIKVQPLNRNHQSENLNESGQTDNQLLEITKQLETTIKIQEN